MQQEKGQLDRWKLLINLNAALSYPMDVLAVVWLVLTIIDLTGGLSSWLNTMMLVIWALFVFHFILQFILAPKKLIFIRHNLLSLFSLLLPALRVLRIFRLFRFLRLLRGTSLIRVTSSINRGMRTLRKKFGQRGLPYVLALTLIIIFAGAAGILHVEQGRSDYIDSYPTALWWASMMVTTMGTDFFPLSTEGRILSLLLAIYGFAIFGYVTAWVASFFIEKK